MHGRHAARGIALAAAIAFSLLVVSGAGGSGALTPKRGGTAVMWASGYETPCITPWLEACFTGTTFRPFSSSFPYAVLAGAFRLRPDWTFEPYLVSGADFTRKSPWVLTYHIRPEARWSDGVPVTAGDFVFTQRTLKRYKEQLTENVQEEILDRIASVRALDAKTVQVVLRKRWASWRFDLFSTVLPRHVLRGEDYPSVWRERLENPRTGEPIGSGPFLVSSWERGRRLTLVRNSRYWGPHPAYLARLVVRFDAAGDPSQSFRKGEVHIAQGLQPDTVPSLRTVPGIKRLSGPVGLETIAIRLGAGGHPALRNKLVRQALAYGIDRQEIVRELFRETVPSQQVAESAIFPSSSPYYRPSWSRYGYRPAEARRLLEQAGCGRGEQGIYVCAGEQLSLRVVTTGDRPDRRRTLELVQSQLRRVGVEVVPEYASQQVLFGQIAPSGDFDLLEVTWVGRFDPGDWIIVFGCGRPFNYMGYCRRLVTADLDQANLVLDAEQQARVLNRADARIAKDVPLLPLYLIAHISAFRRDLRGVAFHPLDPFWRAEEWWLDPDR